MGGYTGQCVFTVVDPASFLEAARSGGSLRENKPWVTAAKLWKSRGDRDVLVFVADAAHVGELLFCARIGRIEVDDEGTTWWPRDARWIAGHDKTALTVTNTGEPISPGQIRPYVLCDTPAWIETCARGEIAAAPLGDTAEALVHFDRMKMPRSLRLLALRRLATSISLAVEESGQWGVSLRRSERLVRVNVGGTEVCLLFGDNQMAALVEPSLVPRALRRRLREGAYPSAKGAHLLDLAIDDFAGWNAIQQAHRAAVKAAHKRGYNFASAHAPSVLALIALETGRALRPPAWFSERETPMLEEDDARSNDAVDDDFSGALEGEAREVLRWHRHRERELRTKKIVAVLRSGAALDCEVCGYNFGRVWGSDGDGFIEVHHLRPLGARDEAEATPLTELALLCANCHAMAHRGMSEKGAARGLDELRRLRAEARG